MDAAYEISTIKAVLALYDNYELDVKNKEVVTPEERREEDELLDKVLETEIMKKAMKFLSDKGYVPNNKDKQKDALKCIWFSRFNRTKEPPASSGFEMVFLAEQIDKEIIGLHNWIYFAKQEAANKATYLGYTKQASLGNVSIFFIIILILCGCYVLLKPKFTLFTVSLLIIFLTVFISIVKRLKTKVPVEIKNLCKKKTLVKIFFRIFKKYYQILFEIRKKILTIFPSPWTTLIEFGTHLKQVFIFRIFIITQNIQNYSPNFF